MLAVELEDIRARRMPCFPSKSRSPATIPRIPIRMPDAHRVRALGLCFSGGGIRSATFNLGVLQGLAELGLLPFIDYLSTVSGGGYIGAWLHGIIRNKYGGNPVPAQDELHPRRVPGGADADPISFLRKYSNYLAPQPGLFSPDFWTIGSVWMRNMSLNLTILLPFLMAVVLTVLLSGVLQQTYGRSLPFEVARYLWVVAAGRRRRGGRRQPAADRFRPVPGPEAAVSPARSQRAIRGGRRQHVYRSSPATSSALTASIRTPCSPV